MLGIQGKHQNKPPLPFVPGNEIAGEIVALGEGVRELKVGQRIATGGSRGGFAEYCVTNAANAVPIPDAMPYAEATNFPTLYPTAYGALRWKADMQPGDVFITDYHLEGKVTGLDVLQQLRIREGRDVPAILLSGDLQSITRVVKTSIPQCRFLSKPVDTKALLSAISELSAS
jgi:Zn-dependent alcohol dehydrogenase